VYAVRMVRIAFVVCMRWLCIMFVVLYMCCCVVLFFVVCVVYCVVCV